MQLNPVRLIHEPYHPHFDAILDHVGSAFTPVVEQDPLCRELCILTGADYLLFWAASAIRRPEQLLPVIHLYGGPACGKTALAWLLQTILAEGYRHISARRRHFNDELDGTVLAVAEDAHGSAFSDLVTSPTLTINHMRAESYQVPNRLHVIACSNTPPEKDDPAVVAIAVPPLTYHIPDAVLRWHLEQEVGDFLLALFQMELPDGNLPVPKCVAAR